MANILLVDDDRDVLVLAQKVLESAHHHVESAQDAIVALEMLANSPFDMVISDANMPHYSGYDLIQTLRKHKRYQSLSLIMLTGRRERQDIEKAIRAGIDDYIVKPVDAMRFLEKVQALVAKRPQLTTPELDLSLLPVNTTAHLRRRIHIDSISERGLTLRAAEPVGLGSTLEIESNLFLEVGIPTPLLKVISCTPEVSGDIWKIETQFAGLKEAQVQRLRMWIHSHRSRLQKAGALS